MKKLLVRDIFEPKEIFEIRSVKESAINLIKTAILDLLNTKNISDIKVENIVFAGGMFASLFQKESINDIDIFILENDMLTLLTLKNTIAKHPNANVKVRVISDYKNMNSHIKEIWDTTIPLLDNVNSTLKIQLILTNLKSREEVLDTFDFKHCQVSMVLDSGILKMIYKSDDNPCTLFITREIYDAIKNKKLIPNNWSFMSDKRFQKFVDRSYQIDGKNFAIPKNFPETDKFHYRMWLPWNSKYI